MQIFVYLSCATRTMDTQNLTGCRKFTTISDCFVLEFDLILADINNLNFMNMRTLTKNLMTLAVLLFAVSFANAQTHFKAAANCILHDDYVKAASKTKNAVSCVDCYCKICGDKKAKEKEAKRKAQEITDKQKAEKQKLEDQKKLAENKKKAEAERQAEKQKAKDNEAILVAPTPKVSNTDNTETKKKIEPKKETKIVSKKSKTIDKEKIETLLNEIGKVYADSKNFKHKNNYYCKFAFSGTKVTITRTDMGGSRDFTFKHTFDLADIKSISHINNGLVSIKVENVAYESGYYHYKEGEKELKTADWEIDRGFPITYANYGFGNVNYNDGNDKVFNLLRQAALEAGATLHEEP